MLKKVERNTGYEDLPDILVPEEVASYLGLHVKTVRAYIACGRLRAARTGKTYHLRKEWILEFLDASSEGCDRV